MVSLGAHILDASHLSDNSSPKHFVDMKVESATGINGLVDCAFNAYDSRYDLPVQKLKKLNGRESENLLVVLAACACTATGNAKFARISDTKLRRH